MRNDPHRRCYAKRTLANLREERAVRAVRDAFPDASKE